MVGLLFILLYFLFCFLSAVPRANTTSRPIVREIDRDFSRTVLINTKFDNRVKVSSCWFLEELSSDLISAFQELRDKESAEKYLQAENLPANKRPFFISMPLRRGLDPVSFAHVSTHGFAHSSPTDYSCSK